VRENIIAKSLFKTGTVIINTAGTDYYEVTLDKIAQPFKFKRQLESLRNRHLQK